MRYKQQNVNLLASFISIVRFIQGFAHVIRYVMNWKHLILSQIYIRQFPNSGTS
jgi:hypothetical protein